MKIVVTGANGQLGQELVLQLQETNFELHPFTKSELDITNENIVNEVITKIEPDIIINAAAYTKVDQAEIEEETAYLVNAFGQRNLAVAAEKVGAKICYISTDYVFDGSSMIPYREYDRTNPLGVYGKSKLVGEELTKSLCSRYFIVRTAWVYGEFGQNFVKTMLRLAKEKEEIDVVNDQVGSPTYTVDLARFIIDLVQTEKFGTYHCTNSGSCSWYEFATAIFEESNISVKVNPITTEQFPRLAARPKYSVLDNFAMKVNGFPMLRHWREALKEFLKSDFRI
ncbi:dTDP-4-dehydrorhamnose reductase [Geobacillus zalihae]|uniref:dTDP-4-dehydrorhamnose reductase n=1 Tax=Geobacillus zalihae TaxID=213419 RepID=UPI0026182989|nr:dTDP-4-dehydrorhamnose reductase [Geobacillus zalihae]WKA47179.1 dTDP-4-dehydrorhamnose reductase [Geobacillus zalihae]